MRQRSECKPGSTTWYSADGLRKVPAKPREYGPYPEVSYELVKTAPDRGDRSADQNGVLRIRRSATPEPDQRVLYEALGVPTEIIRRQSHFPA